MGPSNLAIIKKIKETLDIPVIANGGISTFKDVEYVLGKCGVDGVMSGESILENPALFSGTLVDSNEMADKYLYFFY